MLSIGLTGGIAAGKSTVSAQLAALGAFVVDADALAREAVAPGTPGARAVAEAFGPVVGQPDGALDRAALARIVFADEAARHRLNAIVHPLVRRRAAELIAQQGAPIVVQDIPLLVESGLGAQHHLVIVVDAPEPERVRRLVTGRAMAEDDAWRRIRAQVGEPERRAAADVWLDTDRPREVVAAEVAALWRQRIVPFERNLRLRRPAPRPTGLPVLEPPDPAWPGAARRLIDRVAAAASRAGLAGAPVEHIGSTAVPGLPARDVIDLQLGVPSAESLTGAAGAALADELAVAGFPPGPDRDPRPAVLEADPARGERLHANADPGRAVDLHLRVAGGPGWRSALLLRDWLTAVDGERRAFAELKRRSAGEAVDDRGYAEGKDPWFGPALERALGWSRRAG